MPLDEPVTRECLHSRSIICNGYLRSDGLWDIEARLVDTKTYDFSNQDRGGHIKAGEALHDLSLRVTLDSNMVIQHAESVSDETPYNYCKQAGQNIASLTGLQIAPGWMRKVRQRIGGKHGCTHLTELLKTIATTAFQTMSYERRKNQDKETSPRLLDTCMSYASDSPVIKRDWPDVYSGDKST
ncbi:MAG: DUF2889 domain-containing protein [Gammaproteobacteria bacterium]|nr:DUF2889 domain-containing protein [Gammaproteobacteria bacterium]NNJ90524.1 DUF2889 domain-containing protein [Gammaproteobacteria bacterium]